MSKDEIAIEKEIQEKGLNAPRLTPALIDEQIIEETYIRASDIPGSLSAANGAAAYRALSCLTICVLVLKNGFTVTGESACASPENFDAELGRKIARDNARNKIWALEGYQLRTKLAQAA
jgi:hypothetical protein